MEEIVYKYTVETILVISAVDRLRPSQTKFLLYTDPYRLPSTNLKPSENIDDSAKRLLKYATNIDIQMKLGGWFNTQLYFSTISDQRGLDRGGIALVYCCMIPEVVKPQNNLLWVAASELTGKQMFGNHLDILTGVK